MSAVQNALITDQFIRAINTYPNTDLGNAERFAADHAERARFCHAMGSWLIWDGTRWAKDRDGSIQSLAKETVRNLQRRAGELTNDTERHDLLKFGLQSEQVHRINAMLSLARNEPGIPVGESDLDSDPWLFNVLNGTIDLRTGSLHEHRRDDLITKIAPIDYAPEASCPLWLKFLVDVTNGNDDLAAYLQRAVGYTLTGDVSEQVLFMLYGTGANGKSTFLEALRAVFGDYAEVTDFNTLMVTNRTGPRNDLAKLQGARFVTATESDEGKRMAEPVVKQITGKDQISARPLYKEFTNFVPQFKFWLGMNHRPAIQGTDSGIWRRIHLIPFEVCIEDEKRDRHLLEKLKMEAPGILAWAIQGLAKYRRVGLGQPEVVRAATTDYRLDQDVLGRFIEARCLVAPTTSIGGRVLYDGFRKWCAENVEEPWNERRFSQSMAERKFQKTRGGPTRGVVWFGIQLDTGRPVPQPN